MALTLALAGDTMLGRGVAQRLAGGASPESLVADELAAVMRGADLTILNLECCISERGEPWPAPRKPFFFRAPPAAVGTLRHLGVTAVTLANNHALDFGTDALADTRRHLRDAGIACIGAGDGPGEARAPLVLEADGVRIGLVAFSDHPADFAVAEGRPGIAYADLRHGAPRWVLDLVERVRGEVDLVVVTPHWGPNMTAAPLPAVRRAADGLLEAGASLVVGHSAHVFHGVLRDPRGVVAFDLGDFLDDYAVDPQLRNDLGLAWQVSLDRQGPIAIEAVPIALDFCHTRRADATESAWIAARLGAACAELGTDVISEDDRLRIPLR